MVFELKQVDFQMLSDRLSNFPTKETKYRDMRRFIDEGIDSFTLYMFLSSKDIWVGENGQFATDKIDFYYGEINEDLFSVANKYAIDISDFSYRNRYAMIVLESRDSVIMCLSPYQSEFWRLSGLGCFKSSPYTPIKGARETLEFTDISYKRLSTWLRYPELLNLLRTGPFSSHKEVMPVHVEYLRKK